MKKKIYVILIAIVIGITVSLRYENANAENYKYTSWIENLTTPITKSKNAKIRGWVMTTAEDKSLKILIDNQEATNIISEERPDVIQAITGYGGIEANPTPGFQVTFDSTKLAVGNHEIKIEIIDNVTGNVIGTEKKNFVVEDYKYTSWLENLTMPITKSKNAKIRGWVMATAEDKTLKISIDNQEATNIISEERPDVIKAITGYGGIEKNPTPGFQVIFDSTKLDSGNHEIKLEIIDNVTGNVIGTEKKNFIVEEYKYTSWLENLVTPIEKNEQAKIRGWVMTTAEDRTLKVSIDNQEVGNIESEERSDVIKAITGYGGIEKNPTPGFQVTFDSTKLAVGNHEIKIEIIDNVTGSIIGTEKNTFIVKGHKYNSWIQDLATPVEKSEQAKLKGWIMTTAKDKTLKVYIDNQEESNIENEERSDVIAAITGYGGIEANPTPGFQVTFDSTKLTVGNHKIKIEVIDNITGDIIGSQTEQFTVKNYDYDTWLETPKTNSVVKTSMDIRGWFMSAAKDKKVTLYVDDKEIIPEKEVRPDVIAVITGYGGIEANPTPGFKATYDTSNLADGTHQLKIVVTDNTTGDIIKSDITRFKVKKYDGTMYFENFTNSNFTKEIQLRGWEMSELDNSYIKVYMDSKEITPTITREARQDVIDKITNYGGVDVNPTPGFNMTIDLTPFSQGVHTLTFKLYTKLNEEIYSYSKTLMVYKDISFGVDVSKYQQNIDWSKVRSYGINFAFVRVGYRGYGTGQIMEDEYFRTNVTGASNAGLKVGIYFFSQAINASEAEIEANYAVDKMMSYGLSSRVNLPIVIDTEFSSCTSRCGRADGLSKQQRTQVVRAFVNKVKQRGFTPMVYASKSFLYDNLDMSQLSDVKVWLAHYTNSFEKKSDYTGIYEAWQYTSTGSVNGINGNVDRNISYVPY